MSTGGNIHYWCNKLTFLKALIIRVQHIGSDVKVYADSATDYALKFSKWLGLTVEPANIAWIAVDPQGHNIGHRIHYFFTLLRDSLLENPGDYSWLPSDQKPYGAEWQRLLGSHAYEQAQHPSLMLAYVENYYLTGQNGTETPSQIIVDVGYHSFASGLSRVKLPLKITIPLRIKAFGDELPLLLGRHFAQVAWRLAYLAKRQLRPAHPDVRIPKPDQGIILILYEDGLLDRGPLGATFDWVEQSGIDPGRIVFYFNRSDSQLDNAAKEKINARGHGWIEYYRQDNFLKNPLKTGLYYFLKSLTLLLCVRSRYDLWRWQIVASSLPRIHANRDFIKEYNVIAIHQHHEFVPYVIMQAIAARQENAMFIWGLWSFLVFRESWYGHAFADLLQTWGEIDYGYFSTVTCDYGYAIKAGILGYDGLEPDDEESARKIRASMWANPRFVITLFDSSHQKYGKTSYHSTEDCADYYKMMFELVRDNPDWGCLVKSKNLALNDLPENPELRQLLQDLISQGRAVDLPRTVKPSRALQASDIAVCFSINSAGMIAAARTGKPVLHYNSPHLTCHPMYLRIGEGKVIFNDKASLLNAITSLSKGERVYGDLTPWASSLLDPFMDGMSRSRTGQFMGDFVAARDRGLSKEDALREAAQHYADTIGEEYVSVRHQEHSGEGIKLWKEVDEKFYPNLNSPFPYSQSSLAVKPIRAQGKSGI